MEKNTPVVVRWATKDWSHNSPKRSNWGRSGQKCLDTPPTGRFKGTTSIPDGGQLFLLLGVFPEHSSSCSSSLKNGPRPLQEEKYNLFGLDLPWFGAAPALPPAIEQMCPWVWVSCEWLDTAPRLLQMGHLTTTTHVLQELSNPSLSRCYFTYSSGIYLLNSWNVAETAPQVW